MSGYHDFARLTHEINHHKDESIKERVGLVGVEKQLKVGRREKVGKMQRSMVEA